MEFDMKTFSFIIMLALLPAPAAMAEDKAEALVLEARQHTMAFAKALKSTLMAGMKAEGPAAAINLCNIDAPALAEINSKDGWQVGRTSLKVRNPNNAPDAWETQVLQSFDQQLAAGADIQTLEVSREYNGEFRYMKAIPVGGPCVICHGDSLADPVQARINELYPTDQAHGYLPGQLRGAFTLTYRPVQE
jgi:hypothetical protein